MASRLTTFIVVLIVAGTLVAGLIVGAQRDDESGPVDLIVTNGRVYTGSASSFAEAVAIRGNTILRVGTNREIKRLRRPQTAVVDAHGGSVLPGFNDAHLHLMSGGLALSHVNLLDATTLEDMQSTVKTFAASHPERPWVRGRGWYYDPFPGGLPIRQQLDAAVPDRPAYLVAYDGHTGWANTRALEAAGITRRTPESDARRHRQGSENGRADGGAEGSGAIVDAEGAAAAHAGRPAGRRPRRHPGSTTPGYHQRAERRRITRRPRALRRAASGRRTAGARVCGTLRYA